MSNRAVAAALGPSASRPLAPPVRAGLEASFAVPLAHVRVRPDGPTETVGDQISGVAQQPATPTQLGRLAHEVAHVVQGRGEGPPSPPAALEAEARQAARAVVGGRPLAISRTAPAGRALGYSEDDDPRAALAPRSDHFNPWKGIISGAEAERAELEDSGISDSYDALLAAVWADLAVWREFRGGAYELSPLPGIISANAALDLKRAMGRARPPFTEQAYVATSLRHHLSDDELAELGGLVRFANSLPATRGAAAFGEAFALSTDTTKHIYEFHVSSDWSLSTGPDEEGDLPSHAPERQQPKLGVRKNEVKGGFTVGVASRSVKVRYTNPQLGMTYTVDLDVGGAKLGAGFSASAGLESGAREGDDLTIEGLPRAADSLLGGAPAEERWLPAAAPPATFWRPDDFAGTFVVFKAEAAYTAQAGPLSFTPTKGEAFELFVFNKGGENLVFAEGDAEEKAGAKAAAVDEARKDLIEQLMDTEVAPDFSTLASLGVGADLEFEAGWATRTGFQADATAPEATEDPATHGWYVLRDTYLYFDTEESQLLSANLGAIADLAAYLGRYVQVHPDVSFRFSFTGHASPRWKGAGRDQDRAATKNYELSSLRAHNVAAAVAGYREQVLTNPDSRWICEPPVVDYTESSESRDDPEVRSVEPVGSADALAEGKGHDADDPEDRRVHIETEVRLDVSDYL